MDAFFRDLHQSLPTFIIYKTIQNYAHNRKLFP